MDEVTRGKNEYGGFLPLELNPGTEYFEKYNSNVVRFNSVKAALDVLIRRINRRKIYIPFYYCPSTTQAIVNIGFEVAFYHIGEDLLPVELPDEPDSIVLLVDYFGVIGKKIEELTKKYTKAEIIVDRAHAFFEDAFDLERIHFVYSAKKFFGIPDGAYLVSRYARDMEESTSFASDYSQFLFVSYEKGTNEAYNLKKESDVFIATNYSGMSVLAQGILKNVDYERVKSQRFRNFSVIHEKLQKINELQLPEACPAYLYPFLISSKGSEIKKKLVKDRIFVPTLWRGENLLSEGYEFEICMSDNAVFLPIDQRYNEEDMKYIALRIEEILNENT